MTSQARRSSIVALVLLLSISTVALSQSAHAWTHHGCKYDNGSISPIQYKYVNISSAIKSAAQDAQTSWDNTSAPGYFGQNQQSVDPELPIFDGNYSGDWWAHVRWSCASDGTYWGNEVNDMRFDIGDIGGLSAFETKMVAVHEFGHAYGLDHTYSGCRAMRQGSYKFSCGIDGPASNDVDGVIELYF